MITKPVVLITERIAEIGIRLLQQSCQLVTPWVNDSPVTKETLGTADAIIVRLTPVNEHLLRSSPKLRVIGRHGVGLDNVDLPAATSRGIPVVFTPCANTNAVAEHTVHLMLALARHALAADKAVREGHFNRRNSLIGFELRRKILGIVGLGAIGSRVARICLSGFDMKVLAFDPYLTTLPSQKFITLTPTLRELLEQADIVTLHLPLTAETSGMINAETLSYMKPSALLINTARGRIVDSIALAQALGRGQIGGAAIDVFEQVPLPPDHPLLSAPAALFSAHIGSSTHEALEEMSERVCRQVLQVLAGERPESVANPEVYQHNILEATDVRLAP